VKFLGLQLRRNKRVVSLYTVIPLCFLGLLVQIVLNSLDFEETRALLVRNSVLSGQQ